MGEVKVIDTNMNQFTLEQLHHMLDEARKDEREACAVVLDRQIEYLSKLQETVADFMGGGVFRNRIDLLKQIAAAIRARGSEGNR